MAMFQRMSDSYIKEHFTHYGIFCGVVPIYMTDSDMPDIAVRNGYPDFLLDIVAFAWQVMSIVAEFVVKDYEPGFLFEMYGEIEK
jgi:hypothetical protein